MIILEQTLVGFTFIGDDNNYYCTISNADSDAFDVTYPVMLGPWESYDPEIPF